MEPEDDEMSEDEWPQEDDAEEEWTPEDDAEFSE